MAKSRYEENLMQIKAARERGETLDLNSAPPKPGPAKATKGGMSKKEISQAITGLIMLAGGFWVWWTFIRTPTPDASSIPPDESAFVSTVQKSIGAWNSAPNSVAQVPMPAARAAAICSTLKSFTVSNWAATIQSIDASSTTDANGKHIASITLTLAQNITVSTQPAIGMFADPKTSIEEGTPIYQTVASMAPGTNVTFSGSFTRDSDSCITELSLTTGGGMRSPNFEFFPTALVAAN